MLLLVASCAKPPSLREENLQAQPITPESQIQEPSSPTEQPSTPEKTDEPKTETTPSSDTPKEEGELTAKDILNAPAIARVTTKGESSEIDATFAGRNEVFTVPYTDMDAIIFDIAKKFGVSLNEVRQALYLNGQRYIKPSEAQKIEEEKDQQEIFNQSKSNPFTNISYSFFRPADEEGYIRAIGCDLSKSILKFELHNFKDVELKRYREVKPKIQNPLTIYFNGKRLIESYCEGFWSLEPNQTTDCYHSGVSFIRSTHSGSVYGKIELNEDLQDELIATQPGYNEKFVFLCGSNTTATNSAQ